MHNDKGKNLFSSLAMAAIENMFLQWATMIVLKDELLKKIVICLIESPFEMTKNAFYFILKVLSVLKVFKILSWLFGHVGKTAWLGR